MGQDRPLEAEWATVTPFLAVLASQKCSNSSTQLGEC